MAAQRGGKRPGAGRKPGRVSAAKRNLSDMAKDYAKAALATLVDVHSDKQAPHSARVSAATAILDRAYGKPSQSHEHSGPGGAPIQTMDVTNLSDDQFAALEAAFGITPDAGDGNQGDDPTGEGET